jgi:endonuclease/exonuclease/phosphatase family metal-dependent hydrolase
MSAEGTTRGGGSAILSRFPVLARSECAFSLNNAVHASLDVNGRTVNVFVTHLPPGDSAAPRVRAARELRACASNFAENRILSGDWNTSPTRLEVTEMLGAYYDSWAVARAKGKAVDFAGNSRDGATHNYRIDYVFFSRNATLSLDRAQVFDTRDANGIRPSDHKPLLTTFSVR